MHGAPETTSHYAPEHPSNEYAFDRRPKFVVLYEEWRTNGNVGVRGLNSATGGAPWTMIVCAHGA